MIKPSSGNIVTNDLIPAGCAARSVLARHELDLDRVGHTLRNHADRLSELELHSAHGEERLAGVERDQHDAHREIAALGAKLDAVESHQEAILGAVRNLEIATNERHRLLIEHINSGLIVREQDIQARLTRHEQLIKVAGRIAVSVTALVAIGWLLYRALTDGTLPGELL